MLFDSNSVELKALEDLKLFMQHEVRSRRESYHGLRGFAFLVKVPLHIL